MRFTSCTFVVLLLTLLATGCNSHARYSAVNDPSYQERKQLTDSFFAADQALMSNEVLAKILDSRIEIGEHVNIAVLPLNARWGATGYDATVQEGIAKALADTTRVVGVGRIPTIVLPHDRMTIPFIREACARLQCDFVLMYRVDQDVRTRWRWSKFHREAKTYATAEAMLLDVRTGLIPWTDLVDDEVKSVRTDQDQSLEEIAIAESLAHTTAKVGEDLAEFFRQIKVAKKD